MAGQSHIFYITIADLSSGLYTQERTRLWKIAFSLFSHHRWFLSVFHNIPKKAVFEELPDDKSTYVHLYNSNIVNIVKITSQNTCREETNPISAI